MLIDSGSIPIIINSLDNKTQCWADTIDVFIHNPLDNSCLPSIVQAAVRRMNKQAMVSGGFLTA